MFPQVMQARNRADADVRILAAGRVPTLCHSVADPGVSIEIE